MTNEKHERGVFKGRSPLFKNLFVWLAVGYILTGLSVQRGVLRKSLKELPFSVYCFL